MIMACYCTVINLIFDRDGILVGIPEGLINELPKLSKYPKLSGSNHDVHGKWVIAFDHCTEENVPEKWTTFFRRGFDHHIMASSRTWMSSQNKIK